MKYKYSYKTTTADFWQLTMYYTYGSIVGVCNLVFAVALIALTLNKWDQASDFFRGLLIAGCLLFPVIQPLIFWQKAKKQAAAIEHRTDLVFDDAGIHVKVGDQESDIPWQSVKRISKKPTMLIIFADTTHGFVLTNRILRNEKERFYQYLVKHTQVQS